MSMEIVTVGVGQCGVQNMSTIWETICQEHQIGYDGQMVVPLEDSSFLTFFDENSKSIYVPRCLIFDFEEMVVDSLRSGKFKRFFEDSNCCVTGEAAGTYGIGRTIAQRNGYQVRNCYRRLLEGSNMIEAMIKVSSTGGGCGSAFSVQVMEIAQDLNPKIVRTACDLLPTVRWFGDVEQNYPYNCGVSIVEPYNSVLNMVNQKDQCVMDLLFDNAALQSVAGSAGVHDSTYKDLNYIIAAVFSMVTSCERFATANDCNLSQLRTNLIPFPFMNYLVPHISQVLPKDTRCHLDSLNLFHVTSRVFSEPEKSGCCAAECATGEYIGCSLFYRGDVEQSNVFTVKDQVMARYAPKFVEWTTGFTMGTCPMPFCFPGASFYASTTSVPMMCSLANNTAVNVIFNEMAKRYDMLVRKRSFTHWFDGMDMEEFLDARDAFDLILDMYSLKSVKVYAMEGGDEEE